MLSTADISDANTENTRVCQLQFRSFGRKARFCGPCVPLAVEGDHRPVDEALSRPGKGAVLVVDAGGSLAVGVFGDRLAKLAVRNGWQGLVIHGLIRDSTAINALDLGVKALGTTALRSAVPQPWKPVDAVEFGGVRFSAGLWVYCDEDAVLVGPAGLGGEPQGAGA